MSQVFDLMLLSPDGIETSGVIKIKSAEMLGEKDLIQIASMDELYIVRDHTIFERNELESNANIEYADYQREDARVELQYSVSGNAKDVYIDVPMIYYPGYKACVDGNL